MKRYIEIVYDNSESMNDFVGSTRKYEVARQLFEKEILPNIGFKGDNIVLRLLAAGFIFLIFAFNSGKTILQLVIN